MLPTVIGVVATLVAGYGIWRPSLWYDEAATISATDRTLPQLAELVEHVDSVHAAYYLAMRGWTALFGFSEFAVRAPSAIAVGLAAALLVILGRRLWDTGFGVVAAVVFIAMPRVAWAGSEARSYAATITLAAAASVVLLVALDRGRWWWVGYGALVVASGVWFLIAATLLVAHLGMVLVLRSFPAQRPRVPRGFVVTAAIATLVLIPYAVWAFGQRSQIDWIPDASARTLATYALFEYPDGSTVYLAAVVVVLIAGVAAGVVTGDGACWRIAAVAAVWCAVPAVVVLAYSWPGSSAYTPRYLAFTVPGLALAIAWAIRQLTRGRWWATALVVAVLVGVGVPSYLAQRGPYGRAGGTDFSQVADYIGAHARPGDCVAYAPPPSWNPVSSRMIARAKPADFAGLRDVGAKVSADDADLLWDVDKPVTAYRSFARGCRVMWVLTDRDRSRPSRLFPGGMSVWRFDRFRFTDTALYRELAATGLRIDDRVSFNNSQVVRMVRP